MPESPPADRLDILINNAGIGTAGPRQTSADGFELRFALNYLAGFLLAWLLLPSSRTACQRRLRGDRAPIDTDEPKHWCRDLLLKLRFTDAWSSGPISARATPLAQAQAFLAHQGDQRTRRRIEIAVTAMNKRDRDAGENPSFCDRVNSLLYVRDRRHEMISPCALLVF
jgi:hypothetical protein